MTDRVHQLLTASAYGLQFDDDGDAFVDEASTRCYVMVAGDRYPDVVVFATVTEGLAASPELFRWVTTRGGLPLCRLGIHLHDDETVAVSVRQSIPGAGLDACELGIALLTVGYVAAEVGREIALRLSPPQR